MTVETIDGTGFLSSGNSKSQMEFPCPLCNEQLEIRKSKNDKPYCVCMKCGMQLFVRGRTGIKRLQVLLADGGMQKDNAEFKLSESSLSRAIISKLTEMLEIQKFARNIEHEMEFPKEIIGAKLLTRILEIFREDIKNLSNVLKTLVRN
jgi:hypothetical protein